MNSAPWLEGALFGPPSDPRGRPGNQPTYATATKKTATATDTDGQPPPIHPTEIDRQHRTHILRRLDPNTTPTAIIQQLTAQLGFSENELLEAVLRDPKDRRRFYVTYTTIDNKQHALGKGFTIGNTVIKPSDNTIDGYIPFPPYYIDLDTLDTLLRPYGELVRSSFVQTTARTRVAGYKFNIKLKPGAVRPTTITYNNCQMGIHYTDDLRQCTHCKTYGHLVAGCRTRIREQQERATQKADHLASLRKIYESEIAEIQLGAERTLQSEYIELQKDLKIAADVFEADLSEYRESSADANAILYWTAAHTQYVTTQKERYAEAITSYTDQANWTKDKVDTKYRTAGGELSAYDRNPMEIDTDRFALTTLSEEVMDEPDGEIIAFIRDTFNDYVQEYRLAASPSPPPPPAVGEETATIPTTAILQALTHIAVDTVIPILADTTEKPMDIPPKAKKPPPKKQRTKSQSGAAKNVLTMDEWTSRTTKGLNATYCRHAISFQTSNPDCTQILYSALAEVCTQITSDHPNPTEIVIQTSSTDSTHRCIYVRNDVVKEIIIKLLMDCHKAKIMLLTSKIEVGVNPTYNSAYG